MSRDERVEEARSTLRVALQARAVQEQLSAFASAHA